MGLFSSKKSKTTNNTRVDNRQLAVQDGIGGQVEGDQNVNILDGGAIRSAERTTGKALALVDDGLSDAGRTSRAAIDGNTRVTRDAIDAVGDTSKDAFDTVRRFGGDALSVVDKSTERAIASADDANRRSFDFGADALGFARETGRDAFDAVGDTTRRAFDFGTRLQDEMTGVTRGAFDQVQTAFQGVKNLAEKSVRGEAGEVSDTAKTALYVAGGLGAAVLLAVTFRSK